mgnify:CR=1 FL=1
MKYAEDHGWRFRISNGHAWGRLYCPKGDSAGCSISVNSTPRRPEDHAKHIRALVGKCGHSKPERKAP